MMICVNCLYECRVLSPAGLCWECHWNAEDDADRDYAERPLSSPTGALPGTRSKLVVFEERLAARVALHHPADRRIPSAVLTLLGEIWLAHLLEQDELEVA